jgi:hypothetical protein
VTWLLLAGAAAFVSVVGVSAVSAVSGAQPEVWARPRQQPTSSTEPGSTTSRPEILVPGPSPESTTLPTTTTTEAGSGFLEDLRQDFRELVAEETGRTVAIAIGGLVLVALILAVLTIRYWRKTKPVKAPKPPKASKRGRTKHDAEELHDHPADAH